MQAWNDEGTQRLSVIDARGTGWQSVPKFVRFAVWVWAVGVILSVVVGVLAGIIVGIAASN